MENTFTSSEKEIGTELEKQGTYDQTKMNAKY